MGVKTIEAEYHIEATQMWEIKYIEGWPRDSHGPLPLESAHDYYIKWGLLHVQWQKDDGHVEYDPTYEGNGDVATGYHTNWDHAYEEAWHWLDAEYNYNHEYQGSW